MAFISAGAAGEKRRTGWASVWLAHGASSYYRCHHAARTVGCDKDRKNQLQSTSSVENAVQIIFITDIDYWQMAASN